MKVSGRRRTGLLAALGILWLGAVLHYARAQMDREQRAGGEGTPATQWPAESILARPSTLPVLVLALHPKCPCSKATLEELGILQTSFPGKLRVDVLFVRPEGCSDDWVRGPHWDLAGSVPGVFPVIDPDGREARCFGARTSGHAFLYAPGGKLLFSGGITRGRGQSGSNAGRSSIEKYLGSGNLTVAKTSVFGCALQAPGSRP